jgi:hypothetical protein
MKTMKELIDEMYLFANGTTNSEPRMCKFYTKDYGYHSSTLIKSCVDELDKAIQLRDIVPVSACQKLVLELLLQQIGE